MKIQNLTSKLEINVRYWACLVVIMTYPPFVIAQEQEVVYLNANWQSVKLKSEALYYRTVSKQPDGFLVKDYYLETNQLQMEAICSALEPTPVINGSAKFFYKNGQLEKSATYNKGKQVGPELNYHPNGQRKSEVFYDGDQVRVFQYWSEDGTGQLLRGTGLIRDTDTESGEMLHTVVKDSVRTAIYIVMDKADTVYLQATEQAQFRGGLETMYRAMANTMVYPKPARRSGVEGKVIISFLINERGQLEQAKVLKGIGSGCDEEAVRALQLQQNWIPARYEGKPVTMRLVLPIIFKLR